MSASTNSALHVWTYWISSYWDPSNIVRGGENPVNPLFIHHTIPHISVEPSQPYSTPSTPRCFKSFPSPAPRRRRFALNIICYPGYQETDSMALRYLNQRGRWRQVLSPSFFVKTTIKDLKFKNKKKEKTMCTASLAPAWNVNSCFQKRRWNGC